MKSIPPIGYGMPINLNGHKCTLKQNMPINNTVTKNGKDVPRRPLRIKSILAPFANCFIQTWICEIVELKLSRHSCYAKTQLKYVQMRGAHNPEELQIELNSSRRSRRIWLASEEFTKLNYASLFLEQWKRIADFLYNEIMLPNTLFFFFFFSLLY